MPVFSPDGNWLAYSSNKSGREELYVRPFPGPGNEVQISSGGAGDPKWSLRRQELLFASYSGRRELMVAPYTVQGNVFKPQKPRPWAPVTISPPPVPQFGFFFDLHPDGIRFLIAAVPEATAAAQRNSVNVMFNFFEELKQRVPVGQ
jgi:serine/threonine-protein kinase